jgi:hypothetical protein
MDRDSGIADGAAGDVDGVMIFLGMQAPSTARQQAKHNARVKRSRSITHPAGKRGSHRARGAKSYALDSNASPRAKQAHGQRSRGLVDIPPDLEHKFSMQKPTVYIAASFRHVHAVRLLSRELRSMGYEVFDWTEEAKPPEGLSAQ